MAKRLSAYSRYRNRITAFARRRGISSNLYPPTETQLRKAGITGSELSKQTSNLKNLSKQLNKLYLHPGDTTQQATQLLGELNDEFLIDTEDYSELPQQDLTAYINYFNNFMNDVIDKPVADEGYYKDITNRPQRQIDNSIQAQNDLRNEIYKKIDNLGGGEIGMAAIGKAIQERGDEYNLGDAIDKMLKGFYDDMVFNQGYDVIIDFLATITPEVI